MCERHVRGSGDASVGDARQARPALGHDAPSGVRQAGIDSEYGAFDGRGKPPCPLPCPPASCARRLCYKRLFVIILSHRFEERIEEAAFFHFSTALVEGLARRRPFHPMPRETPDPVRIAPLRVSGDARRPARRPAGAKRGCRCDLAASRKSASTSPWRSGRRRPPRLHMRGASRRRRERLSERRAAFGRIDSCAPRAG